MEVILSGNCTVVKLLQLEKIPKGISVILVQALKSADINPKQRAKILCSRVVIVDGRVTEVKLSQ